MTSEMYSEVFTLFRLNESGIYVCLLCEENIFVNLELEPHALEEHLLNVHELTFQHQDELLDGDNDNKNLINKKDRNKNEDDSDYVEKVTRKRKFNFISNNESDDPDQANNIVDKSTVFSWMGHIQQRRRTYGQQIKKLQIQLDDKYKQYKQIGQDIDYLNEEIDQYRMTWLKEQKRIETITNFLTEKNRGNFRQSKDLQILEDNEEDLDELLDTVNDAEYLNEAATISPTNQKPDMDEVENKKTKIVSANPVFKVRFAKRN